MERENNSTIIRPWNYPRMDNAYFARLATFQYHENSITDQARAFALYGFVWSGLIDNSIHCDYCHTVLHNYDLEKDDILEEHVQKSPECRFILPFIQRPDNPSMQRFLARLESLNDPSCEMLQNTSFNSLQIVELGGFFDRRSSEIKCYHCNIVFEDLDEKENIDEIWAEHSRTSHDCGFLLRMKGCEFVMSYEELDDGMASTESDQETEPPDEQRLASDLILEDYLKQEDSQHLEELNIKYRCKVCLANYSTTLFLPCRHFSTCTSCAKRVKTRCHICSQSIEEMINIFIA